MLPLTIFTRSYFRLIILNGDETCHFAFVQHEKDKTHQGLISQLTLPHSGKSRQFYEFMYLYSFIEKTFWAADFIDYHTV